MMRSDRAAAPGDWVEHAACVGQRMWYSTFQAATNDVTSGDREMEAEALATCSTCPVMLRCRRWALSWPDPATDMVAGGMTPRQRWIWRKRHDAR